MLTSLGRERCIDEGIDFVAHLTKPIKASQLHEVMMRVFGEIPEEVRPAGAEGGPSAASAQRTQLKILLADDNGVNQQVALALSRRWATARTSSSTARRYSRRLHMSDTTWCSWTWRCR